MRRTLARVGDTSLGIWPGTTLLRRSSAGNWGKEKRGNHHVIRAEIPDAREIFGQPAPHGHSRKYEYLRHALAK